MVCIRPSTGISQTLAFGATKTGTGPYTYTFWNTAHANVSLDYIILEPANLTAATTTGYGFQIFNVDGNLVFAQGAITGNPTLTTSTVYTGADYLSVYACINASVFWSSGYNYVGFRWDVTGTKIQFSNWLSIPPTVYTNNQSQIVLVKTV
jgi:hypothetical protein